MNKSLLLGAACFLYAVTSPVLADTFEQDQVVIEGGEVVSLIQSSKVRYADWYLFVARIDSIKVSPRDGASADDLVQLLPSPGLVEIMTPKTTCMASIHAASAWGPGTRLTLKYLKKAYFTATPDDPHHDWFLKATPVANDERDRAECILDRPRPPTNGRGR